MSHLVTILQKPAQASQLQTAISHIMPQKLTLVLQTDSGRIDRQTVANWSCVKNFSGEIVYDTIDFYEANRAWLKQKLLSFQPFSHVALPLYVGLPYWSNVRNLRRSATVINLSDGSVENTSIRDCFCRIKLNAKSPYSIIKTIFLPTLIELFFQADVCFHPFSPAYTSCFAKKTLPLAGIEVPMQKVQVVKSIIEKYNPEHLIIGGFEYSPKDLAERFNISNYIATTKQKFLCVNGENITIDDFLCAEEILSIFKPKAVIGCASDAVLSAKIAYPDIKCFALESRQAVSDWGILYNHIYAKQTRRAGVKFVSGKQLSEIRL